MSVLPETAAVYWRPRLDDARLRRRERGWTLSTFSHTVPWLLAAAVLLALEPLSFPVAAVLVVHAYAIPSLYANRGALVVRPRTRSADGPEATALGLLGDLVGHEARELHARTGLVLERGALGVWLVGEAGALLVRPGGRRVDCWCVKVDARAALRRPHGPPAARAARGRGGLRHGGQPRVQRRALARPRRPACAGAACAPALRRLARMSNSARLNIGSSVHTVGAPRSRSCSHDLSPPPPQPPVGSILVPSGRAPTAATRWSAATASPGSGSRAGPWRRSGGSSTSSARTTERWASRATSTAAPLSLTPPAAASRGGRCSLAASPLA